MQYLSLLLQVATLGLVAYLLVQFKALFREVRTPVVRSKGQMPADFRDRLRNVVARPGAEAPKGPENHGPEGRGDRPENREGRDRDRNREGRDRDRNRDGRDRDRNRDGRDRNENRGDRPENRGDRPENREGRDGRDRDRNRDGRDRNENRGDRQDRGPRPPRSEGAAESAPAAASDDSAPAASAPVASAPAPSFGGRRPLGPQASSEASSTEAPLDALAPSSLAQPVISDAPIRHGRRTLPKAKPRFDDDDAEA